MHKVQILFLATISTMLISCSTGINVELEWEVYRKAKDRLDYSTAANALNRILVTDESNPSTYDSLAVIYFGSGLNQAAAKTSQQGLEKHETVTLVEISANSRKNLGDNEGSLQAFLRLMEMKPGDLKLPYEIAFAYINLQQFDQAHKYIDLVVAHDKSATTAMVEVINNSRQQVPYKAVALNMRGFIHMQKAEYQQAADAYQQSLNVFPDYLLAQNNLKYLVAQASAGAEYSKIDVGEQPIPSNFID